MGSLGLLETLLSVPFGPTEGVSKGPQSTLGPHPPGKTGCKDRKGGSNKDERSLFGALPFLGRRPKASVGPGGTNSRVYRRLPSDVGPPEWTTGLNPTRKRVRKGYGLGEG